jgi:ankyrin repeat protein
MASSTVFISYRREDSAGHAGRLFDRLASKLGRDHVFRDVDNIRPGENFIEAIRNKIKASDVLFVLIGPRWLTAVDHEGRKRLEDAGDLARLEIEIGLEQKIRLVPVLLPGASMPSEKDLPASIAQLGTFNAFEIREATFDQDVSRLFFETKLSRLLNPYQLLRDRRSSLIALACVVLGAAVLAVYWAHPLFVTTPERARTQLAAMGLSFDPHSLAKAAADGDVAAVSLFLRAGMKPDARPQPGTPSALDLAIDNRQFDTAKVLIEGGADVEHALILVARSGNPELFRLLKSKNPSHQALAGAMYQAAQAGHIDVVKQLLDSGLTPNDRWAGSLALNGAAYGGRADVLKLLLDRGAYVNAVDTNPGGNAETALHYATRSGAKSEVIGLLLGSGAAVNAQDGGGTTPLMNALDNREIALMLLAHGADVNIRDHGGNTALMYAAARHLTAMIQILVNKGADVNAQNNAGSTALMNTAGAIDSVDDPQTVQAVLDNGADPDKFDHEGFTALMHAAENGLNGAVRVLIAAGADTRRRSKEGKTALQLASSNQHKQTATVLSGHH